MLYKNTINCIIHHFFAFSTDFFELNLEFTLKKNEQNLIMKTSEQYFTSIKRENMNFKLFIYLHQPMTSEY